MNRLKLFILLFFIAVSLPLGFVIWQSYLGLEQEERAQLQFFSETLFDQMELELSDLVEKEENRSVDQYQHFLAGPENMKDLTNGDSVRLSPLANDRTSDFILGYLQNNPDGSFQTPHTADMGSVPQEKQVLIEQLREANRIFNEKKFNIAKHFPQPAAAIKEEKEEDAESRQESFSARFLSRSKSSPAKTYLGKKQQRVEEITLEQAYNIASEDEIFRKPKSSAEPVGNPSSLSSRPGANSPVTARQEDYQAEAFSPEDKIDAAGEQETYSPKNQMRFQVEVAPFQSVTIKDDLVFVFRRIAINNQIYRQGFLVKVKPFLHHLVSSHYEGQPLADFTSLQIKRRGDDVKSDLLQAGTPLSSSDFLAQRIFPPPFDFLHVSLRSAGMPSSPARSSLNLALGVLGLFMSLGLLAIYQSARAVVLMSERRSQFVSSVTHELKTPLTNIRMYIEMLEQGIASTPEREQEYLKILGSESARLAGLINNVLDLANLEKKQRHFHMRKGRLEDVLEEVKTIMTRKLKQDGFTLTVKTQHVPAFLYDRDVLIQILMNLIENSVKFGKQSPRREILIEVSSSPREVLIAVSDTGPGIPRRSLKKIFNDFYRVDNELTRTTGGTGIGLALVKKFTMAMGGTVKASNNSKGGCTITLALPASPP